MTPTAPIPASLAAACAAHDRHRLDVIDALLDEAAPSAVRELLGAALDLCATLRTERDAMAAQLAEVRKVAADLDRDLSKAWTERERATTVADRDKLRAALASERAHLAACQTRIAGLEQAANERSKEDKDRGARMDAIRAALGAHPFASDDHIADRIKALTARVAELEARPVLTEDALHGAIKEGFGDWRYNHGDQGWPGTIQIAVRALAALGPVTLPPAQDTAPQIVRAYIAEHTKIAEQVKAGDFSWHPEMCKGLWHTEVGAAIQQVAMSRALASLGAPPTSPPAVANRLATEAAALLRKIARIGALAQGGEQSPNAAECIDVARRLEQEQITLPTSPPAARPVFAGVGVEELGRVILAKLDPVTLPPAQDRAEELLSAFVAEHGALLDRSINGEAVVGDVRVVAMSRALASLGAPPTSPPAARPVFAGVSEEELALEYARAVDRIPGIRAVLARIDVSLVAPVDPEAVARSITETGGWVTAADSHGRRQVISSVVRATLTAAGVPVTPEVGK